MKFEGFLEVRTPMGTDQRLAAVAAAARVDWRLRVVLGAPQVRCIAAEFEMRKVRDRDVVFMVLRAGDARIGGLTYSQPKSWAKRAASPVAATTAAA